MTAVLTTDAPLRRVQVTYSDASTRVHEIRGAEDDIARHYLDEERQLEPGGPVVWGVAIEFLE